MANPENLIPVTKRTPTEQKRISSLGGKATAKKKKQNKTFQELAKTLLDRKTQPKYKSIVKEIFGELVDEEVNNRVAMLAAQTKKAIDEGDSKAFELLRNTAGEKPVEKVEVNADRANLLEEARMRVLAESVNKTKK
jgi:hypothetical protein